MTDRATGSLIGERNSTVTSPASGLYNLGSTGNAKGDWPVAAGYHTYTDGTFPISNAQMQWMFQADGFPSSGLAANTATTPTNDYGMTFPVDEWIADYACLRSSWTNSQGSQTYYIQLPSDADFTLNANSANGNAISQNGGFTFFLVFQEYTYNAAWGAVFRYAMMNEGTGSHIGGRTLGSTGSFGGPVIFANREYGRLQWRRPADNTSAGDYSYVLNGYSGSTPYYSNQENIIGVLVISQETKNATTNIGNVGAYHNYYSKIKNTSTVQSNLSGSLSFLGSAGSKVDLGVDFARPFFSDSLYSSNGATNMRHVACGFANRPYTNSEVDTLRAHLVSKYG